MSRNSRKHARNPMARLKDLKAKSAEGLDAVIACADGKPYGRPRYSYPGWWNVYGLFTYTPEEAGVRNTDAYYDVRPSKPKSFLDFTFDSGSWGAAYFVLSLIACVVILGSAASIGIQKVARDVPVFSLEHLPQLILLWAIGLWLAPYVLYWIKDRYTCQLEYRDRLWSRGQRARNEQSNMGKAETVAEIIRGTIDEAKDAVIGPTSDLREAKVALEAALRDEQVDKAVIEANIRRATRPKSGDTRFLPIYNSALTEIDETIRGYTELRTQIELREARFAAYFQAYCDMAVGTYTTVGLMADRQRRHAKASAIKAQAEQALDNSMMVFEEQMARIQPLIAAAKSGMTTQLAGTSSGNFDADLAMIDQAIGILENGTSPEAVVARSRIETVEFEEELLSEEQRTRSQL